MSASEWAPLATGLVAAVALVVGVLTVRQKSVSDRRAQWWEPVEWAVEQTLQDSEERRLIGVVVLTTLTETDQPTREEVRIIDALADVLLAESAQNEDHGGSSSGNRGGELMTTEQVDADDRHPHTATRVQVAAARLKLVTSRKLGETAPPWVERLARDGSSNSRSATTRRPTRLIVQGLARTSGLPLDRAEESSAERTPRGPDRHD